LLEKLDVKCPDCADGEIVKRRTKKGRIFYGCSNYPECEFTSWKMPVSVPCPNCGGTLVISNKRELNCLKCSKSFMQENLIKTENEELA
jgi:DNA topoisomerase-1